MTTAPLIAHASQGAVPVTASHAPTGASPRHRPSQMWQSHVTRFRYGYTTNRTTGIGHSQRTTGSSWKTASRNTASANPHKSRT